MNAKLETGAAVRILVRAGASAKGLAYTSTKFVGIVEPGQVGSYQGPMHGDLDWHTVSVGDWDVALRSFQFEAV